MIDAIIMILFHFFRDSAMMSCFSLKVTIRDKRSLAWHKTSG
ncbi:hypothetical protein [Shewanella violacea]|nr:hypothetical protein [Shewanella violacea]